MLRWKQNTLPPSNNKPVLAVTISDVVGSSEKRRTIVRAQYIHHMEIESSGWDDTEGADWYDEEKDIYWIEEGWYELTTYCGDYYYAIIDDPVIAWMPMPELPEVQNEG